MDKPLFPGNLPAPPVSDGKRERHVLSFFPAFRHAPRIELGESPETDGIPSDFAAQPAADPALAAFAQLAAMRLNAQRSLISLLDGQYQYILAEATPKTLLRPNSPRSEEPDIAFGNLRIPRKWGLCERVLDPLALDEGDPGVIIINDLSKTPQFQNRCYIKEGPKFRFYAGVPLRSQHDTIVGALCVLDQSERSGMSTEDVNFLQDLAATIMDYLVTYTIKDQHRRAAEGLHGLLSFSEGDTKVRAFNDYYTPPALSPETQSPTTGIHNESPAHEPNQDSSGQTQTLQVPQESVSPPQWESERRDLAGDLQVKMLSHSTRELFSRAADILQKSNDMDGVMFVDASVAAAGFGSGDRTPTQASEKPCKILAFATRDQSSLKLDEMAHDRVPLEGNLMWLLKNYPRGYSLDCNFDETASSVNEQVAVNLPISDDSIALMDQESVQRRIQHVLRLKTIFPEIKSALHLPLWDFERNRWFASCFCWSTRAERNLSEPLELPFLKAFGHSIMQEVARCDALNTNQTKTTFLSSLSHELRSPLHGILGSVQLMQSTPLDSFQATMVNSINVCGRTLLETVQHLLDHAERKDSKQNYSIKTVPKENTIRITSSLPPSDPSSSVTSATRFCNVGLVTEEIVETMFLGEARFDVSLDGEDLVTSPKQFASTRQITQRRNRFIILDIRDVMDLEFSIAASSYGRLVMNLLGNALKFTESGFILVRVRVGSSSEDGSKASVTLEISDSGIGIANKFLLHEAFEPFRKANQHSPGTGVGLNVVKRIIEDVGGYVEITSEPQKGTDVTLKLNLERHKKSTGINSPHVALLSSLSPLKSRNICIFHAKPPGPDAPPESLLHWEMLNRYMNALIATLSGEINMNVTRTSIWDGSDEFNLVICPEVSFQSLTEIQKKTSQKPPAILFIAMDTIEANTLRCDARIMSSKLVVEVITQPCGPFKLGMIVRQCLQRYEGTAPNTTDDATKVAEAHHSMNGSPLVTQLGPKLGIYSSMTLRLKDGLPAEQNAPTIEEPPLSPTLSVSSQGRSVAPAIQSLTILIVDDNAVNRRLLSVFMKKRKIAFKEASNGQIALDMCRDAATPFDTILMDISMPVMDGMTSTRLIREHENKTRGKRAHIIALTGLTSASAKLEAWSSGVDDFLTKPVDFKNLEKLIETGRSGKGTGFGKE